MKEDIKKEITKRMKKTVTGKKPDEIKTNLNDKDIQECTLLFGRFNPPTLAHQRIIKENSDRNLHVYLSHSHNEKNPIPYDRKLELCYEAFGEDLVNSFAKNPFEALTELNSFYNKVTVLCGSDRLDEFTERLEKYNGSLYNFKEIIVECVGDREDLPISSSLIRESFRTGTGLVHLLAENIQKYEEEISDWIFVSEDVNASDYVMVKTSKPDGTAIWKKHKRKIKGTDQDLEEDLSNDLDTDLPIPKETDRIEYLRTKFYENGNYVVPHRYKLQRAALDD